MTAMQREREDLDRRFDLLPISQILEAIETMGLSGFPPHFAPCIENTAIVEIPELERLSRTLTLAKSEKTTKIRPSILDVIEVLRS